MPESDCIVLAILVWQYCEKQLGPGACVLQISLCMGTGPVESYVPFSSRKKSCSTLKKVKGWKVGKTETSYVDYLGKVTFECICLHVLIETLFFNLGVS